MEPDELTTNGSHGRASRERLLEEGAPFRKVVGIRAVQMEVPFSVETSQGLVTGKKGDWLATNDGDDPTSDVWVISAERMAASYAPADPS